MRKLVNLDIEYYISLALILIAGTYLALYLGYDRKLQLLVVMNTSFLYIGWGILHHYLSHNLTAKIVVEYVLMGSLGMTIMFFLLRGLSI